MEELVGRHPDGIQEAVSLQVFINLWLGEGRIATQLHGWRNNLENKKEGEGGCFRIGCLGIVAVVALLVIFIKILPDDKSSGNSKSSSAKTASRFSSALDDRAAWKAAKESVFKDGILKIVEYGGRMDVTVNEVMTIAWERVNCDQQRKSLEGLFAKYMRYYDGTAHTCVIRSYADREIGKIKRTAFSGLKYHCE